MAPGTAWRSLNQLQMRGDGREEGGREEGGREEGGREEGGRAWGWHSSIYAWRNSLVKGREHFSAIRVHFHCPVHHSPQEGGEVVKVRVLGTFRELRDHSGLCR